MFKRITAIFAVGVSSGIVGLLFTLLLHGVQRLAYGASGSDFLDKVTATLPSHRFWVMLGCGVFGALGWWILRRYLKFQAVKSEELAEKAPKMPFWSTLYSNVLQIVTIALGSPLGREGAPREAGALFAARISKRIGLDSEHLKLMAACGAGAGLAAIYTVPLSGALFVVEVILRRFSLGIFLPALLTCLLATTVVQLVLGSAPQYPVSDFAFSAAWLVGCLCMAPIFWWTGKIFGRVAAKLKSQPPSPNWKFVLLCILNFAVIGLLAMLFPAILGNGKSAAGLEFSDIPTFYVGIMLLGIRVLITLTSLAAGAMGGLLTPSVAVGALLGGSLGMAWSWWWPGSPFSSFALVGAALFLGASQRMPVTAVVLIFELTYVWFNVGALKGFLAV